MKTHKLETEYLDVIFFTNSKDEEKIVEIFKEGKIFLRWDKRRKMAEIIPNIFKVKHVNVMIVFKSDLAIEEFAKAFISLWEKGIINIRYSKEAQDIVTSPSVLRFL